MFQVKRNSITLNCSDTYIEQSFFSNGIKARHYELYGKRFSRGTLVLCLDGVLYLCVFEEDYKQNETILRFIQKIQ